jgi:hypothetical protein
MKEPKTVTWEREPEYMEDGKILNTFCLQRGADRDTETFAPK